MKVYEIIPDVNNYQTLNFDDEGINKLDVLQFDGTSRKNNWPQIKQLYIYSPRDKEGDFFTIGGPLVFNQKAYKIIHPILEPYCEWLPLNLDGESLYVLNLLLLSNCLNKEKSKIEYIGNILYMIHEYSFYPDKMPPVSVFRLQLMPMHHRLFTYEGVLPKEKEFKYLVESNQLEGLIFEEIWSSEE